MCPGNEIVSGGAFHGVITLVDQAYDGIFMVRFDLRTVFLVRIPGIVRYLADPGYL